MSIHNVLPNALPNLPSEVWLDIFDKVGPTPHIPCVCRYFKELYTTRVTRWAERIVDHLEDCYKEQSPARGIPRGSAVTYDQANVIIKYFKNKINAVRSQLSSDEQDRYKNAPSRSLAVHPEYLTTILPIIDEIELVNVISSVRLPFRHMFLRWGNTQGTEIRVSSPQPPFHQESLPWEILPKTERRQNIPMLIALDLSDKQLSTLPGSIGNLPALTKLDLSENQLSVLPASIGNLALLTKLDLSSNCLTTLPDFIGNLSSLTHLSISYNQLSALPASTGNLSALTGLYLSNNRLTTLPDSLCNLSELSFLRVLENRLTSLPEFIGNLTALIELNLLSNQLATLPDSIGNLTELACLEISYNQLTTLPESIGKLTALTELYVANNHLTTLPDPIGNLTALVRLDLSRNQLTTLPVSISNLSALQYLSISRNPSLAQSTQSLIQLRRLQENGCDVRCDAVVDQAIEALPKTP